MGKPWENHGKVFQPSQLVNLVENMGNHPLHWWLVIYESPLSWLGDLRTKQIRSVDALRWVHQGDPQPSPGWCEYEVTKSWWSVIHWWFGASLVPRNPQYGWTSWRYGTCKGDAEHQSLSCCRGSFGTSQLFSSHLQSHSYRQWENRASRTACPPPTDVEDQKLVCKLRHFSKRRRWLDWGQDKQRWWWRDFLVICSCTVYYHVYTIQVHIVCLVVCIPNNSIGDQDQNWCWGRSPHVITWFHLSGATKKRHLLCPMQEFRRTMAKQVVGSAGYVQDSNLLRV